MPFNWRLQVRLAITNFVVVFIGVLTMKILLTPIGAYLFPANTTDLTSNDASLSANGSPQDHVNFSDEPVPTVSQEITIGGTPIAATTDPSPPPPMPLADYRTAGSTLSSSTRAIPLCTSI